MRQAAQHNAVKNAVNWMGFCPSLAATIPFAARGAQKPEGFTPEGFTYAASANTAG
ncbi:MAG: hypothetical protein ACK4PK_08505 [Alphaproteobacteria bacterium]|jgi:hypothetical protein